MKSDFYYRIDSYKKVNVIFILLIAFAFFYCYLLPYLNVSISSSCEGLPQIYCKSRGLTRAFSEILRFNFEKAMHYNVFSVKIFLFFLIQFMARIVINKLINPVNFKRILNLDIFLTILFFVYAFHNLIQTT